MMPRDRRDVADEIEVELAVERRVDCVCRIDQEKRVAVWKRMHDHLGGYIGSGAWTVLDNELLAEPFRQPLSHQTREDIGNAAGSNAHDYTYRSRRIGLRARHTRYSRQSGDTDRQMQKLTTRKFHGETIDCVPWRPVLKKVAVTADIIWRLELTRSRRRVIPP
jgi:hypothetical protein